MKKIILLLAFVFISNGIMAQAPLEVGGVQLNAGVGTTGWGIPVYVGLDFGIVRDVTLGAQVSFQTENHRYYYSNNSYNYSSSAIGIGVNGNYHFNRILDMPSKFDFYAGANVTFYIWNDRYDDNNNNIIYPENNNTTLAPGVQVGGRYFFTDNFGLNLELLAGETGTTGAKFGITYKF